MNATRARMVVQYLRPLILGRPLHGPERYRPFFIVGSGRCGTTLLRAMLQSHPAVHIPPANPVLRAIIRDYRRYSRLPWATLLRVVLGHLAFHPSWEMFDLSLGPVFRDLVQRPPATRDLAAVLDTVYRAHLAHHKPEAKRWGDKSPLTVVALRELQAVFPDLRVIYLLRDGRDVAASFADAFGDDLQRAAMVWLRAVGAAHAFQAQHPDQFLQVRYEDLVARPDEAIRRVSMFLDLTFDERMLRHHELGLKLGDVERTPYMQGVQKAVHRDSIGRWRKAFDARQIARLEQLLNPTLARLGYEIGG